MPGPSACAGNIVDPIAARRPDVAHAWATVNIAGVAEWPCRALCPR